MKPKLIELDAHLPVGIGGVYRARVMNADGTPASDWTKPQRNLILPGGYSTAAAGSYPGAFAHQIQQLHAGTGNSPNKATLDGTYAQSGTTVTRSTGTGTFVAGNVNDFIKFGTGEIAKIVSVTNTVTVEVDRSQTVAATSLVVYDTSRTLLDAWSKVTTNPDGTAGFNGAQHFTDTGIYQRWVTFNFATETVATTYTEVGVSNGASGGSNGTAVLFSRVVLDTPVTVAIGQFLQLRFDLFMVLGNYRTSAPITVSVTGWPYPYQIQSITANGTYWDVVVGAACSSHYAVGRPIIISGAIPLRKTITSISSTPSDFTVNATSHGRNVGETIVIEGASPAGYNGSWVVATVPNANSLTVTSAANLGAGSGGTVRITTPGTWFNGTHTIASFPNSTTIRITNANNITPAGVAGTVTNSMNAVAQVTGYAFGPTGNASGISEPTGTSGLSYKTVLAIIPEASLKTGLTYGVDTNITGTLGSATGVATGTYNASNRTQTFTSVVASANGNGQTIRQIMFGTVGQPTGQFVVTFDERQRKDNGYQLSMTFTVSWDPDLN